MDNNYNFFHSVFLPFVRKDNSLRINRLVGLLENWEMGLLVKIARRTRVALGKLLPTVQNEKRQLEAVFFVLSGKREFNLCSPIILSAKILRFFRFTFEFPSNSFDRFSGTGIAALCPP